jgi:hypothetical protein
MGWSFKKGIDNRKARYRSPHYAPGLAGLGTNR